MCGKARTLQSCPCPPHKALHADCPTSCKCSLFAHGTDPVPEVLFLICIYISHLIRWCTKWTGLDPFSVWKSQQVFLVTLTTILPCFQPSNSDTVFLIIFLANEQAALHFSLSVFCAGHLRAFQPYFFSYKLYPFLQIIIMGSTMACWVCLLDIFIFTAWPIGIAVGGMYIT